MFGLPNPYVVMVAMGVGAAALIVAFSMGVSYEHKISRIEELRMELASAKAALAVAKADIENARLAELEAADQQSILLDAEKKDQEKINALEALAAADHGACRATGHDIDSLWGPSTAGQR